jgi:glycosyltransferase involved in cell wall biosynthesis
VLSELDRPPMHVLFVVGNYPPHLGGVERHVHSLANALVARGDRATVVTLDSAESDLVEHGVRVIRIKRRLEVAGIIGFAGIGTPRKIAQLMWLEGVTVVSTHTRFFPMTWVGQAIAAKLRVPTIHTEHGSGFVAGASPLIALASRAVDFTFGRRALRNAGTVVGVSQPVVDFVKQLSGRSATVFYNAINVGIWAPEGTVPVSATRLVFLGRLVAGKGWQDFLDAAFVLDGRCSFELHIFGDGPDRVALETAVERLGLAEYTTVHGLKSPTEIAPLLRGAILVNPTTLSEGFQTSLIEAAVSGAQIISYPVPGLDALIADGCPIVVSPPTSSALVEAIAHVIAHPLPISSPDTLRSWGWASRADEYSALVEKVSAK